MRWSNRSLLRTAALLASASLLGACNVVGAGDAGQIYQMAEGMFSGGKKVTLEEAAAVPYASMGLSVGGSTQTMLILASDEYGQRMWTSSARITVTTQNGRIMRTAGLGHNLHAYNLRMEPQKDGGRFDVHLEADLPSLGLYMIKIDCEDRPAGEETITILGKDIHTRRIEERCVANRSQIDWSFRNTYWVAPASGLVWRSIQHVSPRIEALELETLRPPN